MNIYRYSLLMISFLWFVLFLELGFAKYILQPAEYNNADKTTGLQVLYKENRTVLSKHLLKMLTVMDTFNVQTWFHWEISNETLYSSAFPDQGSTTNATLMSFLNKIIERNVPVTGPRFYYRITPIGFSFAGTQNVTVTAINQDKEEGKAALKFFVIGGMGEFSLYPTSVLLRPGETGRIILIAPADLGTNPSFLWEVKNASIRFTVTHLSLTHCKKCVTDQLPPHIAKKVTFFGDWFNLYTFNFTPQVEAPFDVSVTGYNQDLVAYQVNISLNKARDLIILTLNKEEDIVPTKLNVVIILKEVGIKPRIVCRMNSVEVMKTETLQFSSSAKILENEGLILNEFDGNDDSLLKYLEDGGFYYTTFSRVLTAPGVHQIVFDVYNVDIHMLKREIVFKMTDEICFPKIKLVNVGFSLEYAAQYRRKDPVKLTSIVNTECDMSIGKTYEWRLYKISEENFKMPVTLPTTITTNKHYLQIPSQFLLYGKFLATLTVQLNFPKKKVTGQGKGWLEIIPSQLSPIIEDGSFRSVNLDSPIILNGSSSYDPDNYLNKDTIMLWWTCYSETDTKFCKTGILYRGSIVEIRKHTLKAGTTYFFYLFMSSLDLMRTPTSVFQAIRVTQKEHLDVFITCKSNCENKKSNPTENVILKVGCHNCPSDVRMKYEWTFVSDPKVNQKRSLDWKEETSFGRESDIVIVRKGVLKQAEKYVFKVEGSYQDIVVTEASYMITMNEPPQGGNCTISPDEGETIVTSFTIKCSDFKDENLPLTYSFYFNGNMTDFRRRKDIADRRGFRYGSLIRHRVIPYVNQVSLPQGDPKFDYKGGIVVMVTDNYGLSTIVHLEVKVRPAQNLSRDDLEAIVSSESGNSSRLEKLVFSGDVEEAFGIIVCVSVAIAIKPKITERSDNDPSWFADMSLKLVKILDKVSVYDVKTAAQAAASTKAILDIDNSEINGPTLEISVNLLENIVKAIADEHRGKDFTFLEIVLASSMILEAISSLISASAGRAPFTQELEWSDFEKQTQYDSYDIDDYAGDDKERSIRRMHQRTKVASQAVRLILILSGVVMNRTAPNEGDMILQTETVSVWIQKEIDALGHNRSFGLDSDSQLLMPKPDDLKRANNKEEVHEMIVEMTLNPYFFFKSSDYVTSILFLIDVEGEHATKLSLKQSHVLKYFVRRKGNYSLPVTGVTQVLNSSNLSNTDIIVHETFALNPEQVLMLQFDHFTPGDRFIVSIKGNSPPTLNDFLESRYVVPPNDQVDVDVYHLVTSKSITKSAAEKYYIGILPLSKRIGRALKISETTHYDDSFIRNNYTLSIFLAKCVHWNFHSFKWTSKHCEVGPKTTDRTLDCSCTHFSLFGAELLVAPNRIYIPDDTTFFKIILFNPIVIIAVTLIWSLYFLLLYLAIRTDRKLSKKRRVIFLRENLPTDDFGYLIFIQTGLRKDAGTTAQVYLELHGEEDRSFPRQLKSLSDDVLLRGAEDLFCLTFNKSLGRINKISLWHDNSGLDPEWFIARIVVQDVQSKEIYVFFANRWLSVVREDLQIQCELLPATDQEVKNFGLLFQHTVPVTFRDTHLWFSIFMCPPSSKYTSAQRLTCGMCLLLVAMLVNIMFYGTYVSDEADSFTFRHFALSVSQIVIGIESGSIATPIGILLDQLFRRSVKRKVFEREEIIEEEKSRASQQEMRLENEVAPSKIKLAKQESEEKTVPERKERPRKKRKPISTYIDSKNAKTNSDGQNSAGESINTDDNNKKEPKDDAGPSNTQEEFHKVLTKGSGSYTFRHDTVEDKYVTTQKVYFKMETSEKDKYTIQVSITTSKDKSQGQEDKQSSDDEKHEKTKSEESVERSKSEDQENEHKEMKKSDNDSKMERSAKESGKSDLGKVTDESKELSQRTSVDGSSSNKTSISGSTGDKEILKSPVRSTTTIEKAAVISQYVPWFTFPWWCTVVAWTMAIPLAVICSALIILYGLTYGHKRSCDWVISFLASWLEIIFVYQPLQVILIAAFYACVFKHPPDIEVVDAARLMHEHRLFSKKAQAEKRIVPRPNRTYKSLSRKELLEIKRLRMTEIQLVYMILEIILFLLFFAAILVIIYDQEHPLAYYEFLAIKNMFINPRDGKSLQYNKVTDISSAIKYLNTTLLLNLHADQWYNGENITTFGMLSNAITRLIGVARLRQKRVRSENCLVPSSYKECFPSFDWLKEDRRTFHERWSKKPGNISYRTYGRNVAQSMSNPWSYQWAARLKTPPYLGEFETYSGGGYVAELGRSRKWSSAILNDLLEKQWLDKATRALFVDFTTYNPNTHLFCVAALLMEFSGDGFAIPSYTLQIVNFANREVSVLVGMSELFFLFLLVVFTIREAKHIYTHRLGYFYEWSNLLDILILILCYSAFAIYIVMQQEFNSTVAANDPETGEKFVNFSKAAFWSSAFSFTKGFLVFLMTVKLWKLLSFSPYLHLIYATFKISAKILIAIITVVWLFVLAESFLCLLAFGPTVKSMRSITQIQLTLLSYLLDTAQFNMLNEANSVIGPFFAVTYSVVAMAILLSVFYATLTQAFANAFKTLFAEEIPPSKQVVEYIAHRIQLTFGVESLSWTEKKRLETQNKQAHDEKKV